MRARNLSKICCLVLTIVSHAPAVGSWQEWECAALKKGEPAAIAWIDGISTGINLHAGDRIRLVKEDLAAYHQKVLDWCEDEGTAFNLSALATEAFLELVDSGPLPVRMQILREALSVMERNKGVERAQVPIFANAESVAQGLPCSALRTPEGSAWLLGLSLGVSISSPFKRDLLRTKSDQASFIQAIETACGDPDQSLFSTFLHFYHDLIERELRPEDRETMRATLVRRADKLKTRLKLIEAWSAQGSLDYKALSVKEIVPLLRSRNGVQREGAANELLRRVRTYKVNYDEGNLLIGSEIISLWNEMVALRIDPSNSAAYSDRLRRKLLREFFPGPENIQKDILTAVSEMPAVEVAMRLYETHMQSFSEIRTQAISNDAVNRLIYEKLGDSFYPDTPHVDTDTTGERIFTFNFRVNSLPYAVQVRKEDFTVKFGETVRFDLTKHMRPSDKLIFTHSQSNPILAFEILSMNYRIGSNKGCLLIGAPDDSQKPENLLTAVDLQLYKIPEGPRGAWYETLVKSLGSNQFTSSAVANRTGFYLRTSPSFQLRDRN